MLYRGMPGVHLAANLQRSAEMASGSGTDNISWGRSSDHGQLDLDSDLDLADGMGKGIMNG